MIYPGVYGFFLRFLLAVQLVALLGLALASANEPVENRGRRGRGLTCSDASSIAEMALKRHLLVDKITPQLARRTLRNYLDTLLQNRLFWNGDEVAAANALVDSASDGEVTAQVFMAMRGQNCFAFERLFAFQEHALERALGLFSNTKRLAHILASGKFEFKNAEDQGWYEHFLPYLKREMAAIYDQNQSSFEYSVAEVAHYVAQRFFARIRRLTLEDNPGLKFEIMVDSFLSALDPHSRYMGGDEARIINMAGERGFVGVGLVFDRSTPIGIPIAEVVEGTMLQREALLRPGDVITKVDDLPVVGVESGLVQLATLGEVGSTVKFTVIRAPNKNKPFVVNVLREVIEQSSVQTIVHRASEFGREVLYVKIDSFYSGMASDIEEALKKEITKAPFDVLLLDLRGNRGGRVSEAVHLASLFLSPGANVFRERQADGKILLANVPVRKQPLYRGALAIALDRGSASATELFTSALRDANRAVVIGSDMTYGKGTIQASFDSEENPFGVNGVVRITIAQYYSPSGKSVQQLGVASDLELHGENDFVHTERDIPNAIGASSMPPVSDMLLRVRDADLNLDGHISELRKNLDARMLRCAVLTEEQLLNQLIQTSADYANMFLRDGSAFSFLK